MRLFTLTMLAMFFSFASFAIGPISPSSGGLCIGSCLYLSADSTSGLGGSWSCSPTSVATIGGTTIGSLCGVSAGVVTVTYTNSAGTSYGTYTVSPVPSPITGGPTSFCVGSTATFMDATPGGVWSTTAYTGYATVGAATGIATGVTPGMFYLHYTVGGCAYTTMDTVLGTTGHFIGGPSTVCVGSTITLVDSTGSSGGAWSSSSPAIATVSTAGVVTGVAAGTATISLAITSVCGTTYSTHVVTVTTGSIGSISGPAAITVGGTGLFSCSPAGGTWSSTPTSVATIDAAGTATGVSVGAAVISYTAISCGSPLTTTTTVSVNALDGISGHVNFGSAAYYGNVKVWLITYNPSTFDLQASDSMTYYCMGTSVYYQFTGLASDSFRIKASVGDSSFLGGGTTGYIPTYHNSTFYWHDANVVYHTAGTSDINKDINMLTGTATSGPGFIAGNVLTGANRGTSGSTPVVNLHIVAKSNTTGNVVQMAYTDATGHYTLSSLPYDSYTVFPDSLNYTTMPYTAITLSSGSPSTSAATFMQHTISMSITPYTERANSVNTQVASVSVYPNPTSGKLNLFWNETATEKATIAISDITGREIYSNTITMTEGSGVTAVDLSSFTNGMYIITVKSASINYNNKIEIQH